MLISVSTASESMEQLSDVFMAISVAANCLMHGSELPAHLPNLRDRLVYHGHKGRLSTPKSRKRFSTVIDDDSPEENGEMSEAEDPKHGIEANELTLEILLVDYFSLSKSLGAYAFFQDEHLPAHATAIIALSSLASVCFSFVAHRSSCLDAFVACRRNYRDS